MADFLKKKLFEERWVIMACFLMYANLAYMHYEVFVSMNSMFWVQGLSPLFFMVYDVLLSLLFFGIITLGRQRLTFILAYLFLLVFVVSNVVYSHFFSQYILLHVLTNTANFHGTWWLSYLPHAFKWQDLFILFNILAAIYVISRMPNTRSWSRLLHLAGSIIVFSIFYAVLSYAHNVHSFAELKEYRFAPIDVRSNINKAIYNPSSAIINFGVIQGQIIYNYLAYSKHHSLSPEERKEISDFILAKSSHAPMLSDSCQVSGSPNVVMIIIESALSAVLDENIAGKDVMPNLKALSRQPDAYYNPNVISNKGIGESSDAQVSYFTGILPMHSEYAIMYVLRDSIVSLPSLLAKKGYATCITIPNNADFWHQQELNSKYGFTTFHALGTEQNGFWCQDDQIFRHVIDEQKSLRQPFFHAILTLSMHGTYEDDGKPSPYNSSFDFSQNYSQQYRKYIRKCHFTDAQIGKYIAHLKSTRQYDNTILIIASDHEPEGLYMPLAKLRNNALPLIIANSGIARHHFSAKECNQVDLFPTLLDMMRIDSQWRGIGNSLLRPYRSYLLGEKEKRISASILRGNYFK